jgi:hypothetical protein
VPRPVPTPLYHFTAIDHLPSIIDRGLLCDDRAAAEHLLTVEVGNSGIKDIRRRRRVPVPPGGMIAGYVPFYFAPRSPMLFAITHGKVPGYTGGTDQLVYLVTSVERLVELGLPVLFTDRNAVLATASFGAGVDELDALVDWPLMLARMWANTDNEPDRRERRMAECLVHGHVPWPAIQHVATRTSQRNAEVRETLGRFRQGVPVGTKPSWYF